MKSAQTMDTCGIGQIQVGKKYQDLVPALGEAKPYRFPHWVALNCRGSSSVYRTCE